MKVAIVYDRVNKWGGAERVLLALHEIFPKAPLYTSVYDPKSASWAKVFPKIRTSFLQNIPFTKANHEFFSILMPLAFSLFDFSDYDLVISVTSEAAKGIRVKGKTKHVCYCLTPTRYLWSGYEEYFRNPLLKAAGWPAVKLLRIWDKKVSQRPDAMIAISTEVQKRIRKYYGRNSRIIFPPVDIDKSQIKDKHSNGKYYLLVSRLDYGYKKVDLAVKAFNTLGLPLVIVGTGREEKRLKSLSKSGNTKFVGRVSDEKLKNYYKNAKALIMPQEEDFGIVSVEAQNLGVPVIAYKKGGSLDTVIQGKTGVFFAKQSVNNLITSLKEFEKKRFIKNEIIKNSRRFSKPRFKKEFLDIIKKVLN